MEYRERTDFKSVYLCWLKLFITLSYYYVAIFEYRCVYKVDCSHCFISKLGPLKHSFLEMLPAKTFTSPNVARENIYVSKRSSQTQKCLQIMHKKSNLRLQIWLVKTFMSLQIRPTNTLTSPAVARQNLHVTKHI